MPGNIKYIKEQITTDHTPYIKFIHRREFLEYGNVDIQALHALTT